MSFFFPQFIPVFNVLIDDIMCFDLEAKDAQNKILIEISPVTCHAGLNGSTDVIAVVAVTCL